MPTIQSDSGDSIERPEKGDRLIVPGGAGHLNASAIADLSLAAVGYKDAADTLVQHIETKGRNDALLFPILQCYRQYIELRLKSIIVALRFFTGVDFKLNHDLAALWLSIKPEIEKETLASERQALAAVHACILEMHRVDPKGVSFRYPTFEDMARFGHQVNLGHLRDTMQRIANYLDALEASWDAAR